MNNTLKQSLKAKAHHLKPVVMLGAKGLTQSVIDEADIALTAHELIKAKLSGVEKEEKESLAKDLCAKLKAIYVQVIGNTLIMYRKNEEK